MDLLYFLRERVDFIRYFYGATVPVFDETKRKIDEGEDPFADWPLGEYSDAPAFAEEWGRADFATNVVGLACLGMLQTVFQSFLKEHLTEMGGAELLNEVSKMKKGNLFANYREFFNEKWGIDWASSGANLVLIEQMILARNDFNHNFDIFGTFVYLTESHSNKHPDTAFRDPAWPASDVFPSALRVEAAVLDSVIDAVDTLCEYLQSNSRR
mgnify:CR=1 FL=1